MALTIESVKTYQRVRAEIEVDAKIDDWKDIEGIVVADTSELWIGQGMVI